MSQANRDSDETAFAVKDQVQPWLRVHEILHPFDPAEDNEVAFVHALRLACFAEARLSLMCLQPQKAFSAEDPFPKARATLKRWDDAGSLRTPNAGEASGCDVRQLRVALEDPVEACVRFLNKNPTDLIVLATQKHEGKMAWFRRPTAESLTRKAGEMTLFIPPGIEGFVSREDGRVALQSILVPVTSQPRPEPAIEAARRVMLSVPQAAGTVTLLHVGKSSGMPEVQPPLVPGWNWTKTCRDGDVVDTILETAAEISAGLLVMATSGRHGFLDALRSSVTEHVLRNALCPLLSMPEGSFLG